MGVLCFGVFADSIIKTPVGSSSPLSVGTVVRITGDRQVVACNAGEEADGVIIALETYSAAPDSYLIHSAGIARNVQCALAVMAGDKLVPANSGRVQPQFADPGGHIIGTAMTNTPAGGAVTVLLNVGYASGGAGEDNQTITTGAGVTGADGGTDGDFTIDLALTSGGGLTFTGSGASRTVGADFGTGVNQVSRGNHAHQTLTPGTGLTGSNYNGSSATTFAVDFGTGTNQAARGDHNHSGLYDNYASWNLRANTEASTSIVSGATVSFTGVGGASVSRSGNTITIDAGGASDGNNYVDGMSFNTGTGVLTLTRHGLGSLTQSLDGRYLTSFNETDPTWSGTANTTGDIGRTGRVGIGTTSPTNGKLVVSYSSTDIYGIYVTMPGWAIYGDATGGGGRGVMGRGGEYGVLGTHLTTDRMGYIASADYGVYGQYNTSNFGFLGGNVSGYGNVGVRGTGQWASGFFSGGERGVYARGNEYGVFGMGRWSDNYAYLGWDGSTAPFECGIYATGYDYAGYFDGDVNITGNLTVSGSYPGGGGGGYWTLSGSNLYANNTTYNVGIGTTAPSYKLHVEQSSTAPSVIYAYKPTGSTDVAAVEGYSSDRNIGKLGGENNTGDPIGTAYNYGVYGYVRDAGWGGHAGVFTNDNGNWAILGGGTAGPYNYAGYFSGNVHITGNLTVSGSYPGGGGGGYWTDNSSYISCNTITDGYALNIYDDFDAVPDGSRLYLTGYSWSATRASLIKAIKTGNSLTSTGHSAIYGSCDNYGASYWGLDYASCGVRGLAASYGQAYTAGVAGYRYDGGYGPSAGVFGAVSTDQTPSAWGALGFQDASLNEFGGYFTGRGYFSDRVGLATATPQSLLHLSSSDNYDGIRLEYSPFGYWVVGTAATSNLWFSYNGSLKSWINYSTGAWTTSDRNLKNTIEPISDVLDNLIKLEPVSFYYNDDKERTTKTIGLVAQDVAEHLPLAAQIESEFGYYGINYDYITLYTLKGLIELNSKYEATIEDQQRTIESLQDRVSSLEALEARIEVLERN